MTAKKKDKSPFPEKYTDRQWARYVAKGRDLVEQETRVQFALGDVTLDMIKPHPRDGDHGVYRVLDRYADEIGIPFDTLRTYRHIAMAWPKDERVPHVPYAVHVALDACPDRFEIIHQPPEGKDRWTLDDALRRAGRTPHTVGNDEERLDRVRSLLRDEDQAAAAVNDLIHRPEVAERVMTNRSTRRAIFQASLGGTRPRNTRATESTAGQGSAGSRRKSLVEDTIGSRQVLEILGLGTAYYTRMQDIIPHLRVAEFTEDAKRTISENHRRVRAIIDWCDTVIATGDTTMDEQLARLLEGDDPS